MKISLIIPVYRVEKYLDRCLFSVANQTHKDLEIIIVDDGSDDNCPVICDEWGRRDSRIKVIHKENGGLSSARNAGIKIATGDFIGFVDSDDWVHPQMFEILHNQLIDNKDCQFAECTYRIVRKEEPFKSIKKVHVEKMNRKSMLNRFFRVGGIYYNPVVWTKLLRREMLDDFSFVDTLNEDWEATFDWYIKAEKMIYVDWPLYQYFFNDNGIIHSPFKKERLQYLSVWDRLLKKCTELCPEYYKNADFCHKRASFTLLTQYVINGAISDNEEYLEIYRRLREDVKNNFYELLYGLQPFSRKIFLVLIIIIPGFLKFVGNLKKR